METEQLIKELEKRGYCTSSLWHIQDVKCQLDYLNQCKRTSYTIDDEDCMTILDEVVGYEADKSSINEDIYYKVITHIHDKYESSTD